MPARRFATQQYAAQYLNVCSRTIRNKISDGTLTGYRVPGSRAIRVDLDEIDRLMKTIPAALKQREPFGPRARIVNFVPAIGQDLTAEAGGVPVDR